MVYSTSLAVIILLGLVSQVQSYRQISYQLPTGMHAGAVYAANAVPAMRNRVWELQHALHDLFYAYPFGLCFVVSDDPVA